MRLAAVVAAVAVALFAGCGGPDALSREDTEKLAIAKERTGDARATERTLRTSPRRTRQILAEVRRIISDGSLEAEQLDEFGLASLGELQQVVPSVVEADADGVPKDLDRPALRDFLRHAESDPARALRRPAAAAVDSIEATLEDSGADGDTRVGGQTVDQYLREAQSDLRSVWPQLAERLGNVL